MFFIDVMGLLFKLNFLIFFIVMILFDNKIFILFFDNEKSKRYL